MGDDTIHLCVVPYRVLYRASCMRFGICVVNCHILLAVHSGSYRCLHIIYLFVKMQQQA